jgi:hypothetical protein
VSRGHLSSERGLLILISMGPHFLGEARRSVTNQVTTRPNHASRPQSLPDGKPALTWTDLITSDDARRIRQAWHARGQGFESP